MSEHPGRRSRPAPPPLPPPQHPVAFRPRPHGWQAPPLHYPESFSPGTPTGPAAGASQGAHYADHPYAQYPPPTGAWQTGPQGHPPGGAPFGYGGYGAPRPPRRQSGLGRALVGLVGVVSAMVFGLVLVSAFVAGGETDTFVREAGSGRPAAPSDPNAQPVDPADFRAVLEENTLYGQGGLRDGDCVAGDLGSADVADQQRYFDTMMGCLDGEWGQLVTSAGYRYETPRLVVFDAPISTPCGNAAPRDGRTLAFYCPTDAVLYADAPQMQRFFGDVEMAYAVVIGHEFGHHVQHETGILVAFEDAVYARFGDRAELSRRVELQASCMGGLFLGAVAATYPISEQDFAELRQVSLSFGDEPDATEGERDHGSGRSNQEWILEAFGDNDVATCNTFTAPADQVD